MNAFCGFVQWLRRFFTLTARIALVARITIVLSWQVVLTKAKGMIYYSHTRFIPDFCISQVFCA